MTEKIVSLNLDAAKEKAKAASAAMKSKINQGGKFAALKIIDGGFALIEKQKAALELLKKKSES